MSEDRASREKEGGRGKKVYTRTVCGFSADFCACLLWLVVFSLSLSLFFLSPTLQTFPWVVQRLFVPKPACKSVQRLADLVFRMHYPSAWQEQSKPSQDHQKQTKASLGPRSAGKELTNHLGLDCEMVGCRKDGEFSILARVSSYWAETI